MTAENERRPAASEEIRKAFADLKSENPAIRARDAADRIGISEAELVAARLGKDIIRLKPEWSALMNGMPKVGRIMSLVRNESMVHERIGVFENVNVPSARMGIVLGADIDLRLILAEWGSVFAVTEGVASGIRTSIQIFDHAGDAVEKIYLLEDSDRHAFDALVGELRAEDQTAGITVTAYIKDEEKTVLDAEQTDAFRAAWAAMTDVHQLFGILRKYRLDRRQALSAAGPEWAEPVSGDALRSALEHAAQSETDVMIFVGNRGIVQIHTGPVAKLKEMGPWFNVLDPEFNLHARTDHIHECWVTRKPTKDGIVTSLEVFDHTGRLIIQMFGKRREGQKEDPNWRAIINALLTPSKEAA